MLSYRSKTLRVSVFFPALCLFLASSVTQASALTCSQFLDLPAPPGTNSAKYESLETNSPSRTEWILAQNHSLNEDLKKSVNTRKIGDWLKLTSDRPKISRIVQLADGTTILSRNQGLGKAQELVRKTGSTEQILWSSFSEKRNGSVHFVKFSVSPDQKYVALVSEVNGSLDRFNIELYDLKARVHLRFPGLELTSSGQNFNWFGHAIMFQKDYKLVQFDVSNPSAGLMPATLSVIGQAGGISVVKNLTADGIQILSNGASYAWTDTAKPQAVLGKDDTSLYLQVATNLESSEIRRIPLPLSAETIHGTSILNLSSKNSVLRSQSLRSEHFFISDSWGRRQSYSVYDKQGQLTAHFDAPEGTSISGADFNPEKTGLNVSLTSALTPYKVYNFDLATQSFSVPTAQIISEMMTMNGKAYESFFTETVSADGTQIPLRITKLKDLPLNGKNPVFMSVYGGFNISSGFYPSYNPITADFASRGGIIVDPAIRGGNEFGIGWSTSANHHNKVKTLEDVIAVSQYMAAQKYTESRKVIITGTSNGGMVVAASALHSPKDFGLVIPVNGVQDLLHKEILDPKFGEGWSYEYGDSRKPEDFPFLAAISPVEQATKAKDLPKFLILQGRNDSRVNPAHSFKLDAALNEADPNAVRMTSINNSGHWMAGMDYQGWIGWRAQVAQWTTIYDFLGWQR